MASKVYTLASAKGGSGKTLLTASFAAFLSELGKKVLIIDTDASTNGLTLMYLKEVSIQKEILISSGRNPKGVFDNIKIENKLTSEKRFDSLVLNNGVCLIPASFTFQYRNEHLPELYLENITYILKTFRDEFDFIFIDSQAGSDEYAGISIRKDISDEVIVVSEYDPLSAAGVERLKGIFRDDLTYNRTWYLLNKMIPEFIQSFSDFLEIAKYLNPIPWDADVVRAYARRRLPLDLDNGNEFTLALIQTLKTLLDDEMGMEIDKWKLKKEDIFRKPIEEEYWKLISQYSKLDKMERRSRISKIILPTSALFLLLGVIFYFNYSQIKLFENISTLKALTTTITVVASVIITKYISDSVFNKNNGESLEKEILKDKIKKIQNVRMSNFDSLIKNRKSL